MTEAIVPRWEWRMFAERFGAAERGLASLATAPPEVSDEQHVLGLRSEASVKVRDGLMDIKRLEHVDDHGLEASGSGKRDTDSSQGGTKAQKAAAGRKGGKAAAAKA